MVLRHKRKQKQFQERVKQLPHSLEKITASLHYKETIFNQITAVLYSNMPFIAKTLALISTNRKYFGKYIVPKFPVVKTKIHCF